MLVLFEIIDSDQVPPKSSNRTDSNSHISSTGNHQGVHQSSNSVAESTNSAASSPSSTSFPTTKEWFKKLSSYTSLTHSSLGSNSNNQDLCNEMVDLIVRCLQKCGEEIGYMPLFKVIFTALNEANENRYTRLLDGRARDILLSGVITRMVQHVAKHISLIIMCDDVQCEYNNFVFVARMSQH